MNDNNKYIFQVIISIALAAFILLLTIMYGIKTSPIIKLIAITINVLVIFNAYKTIKNKPNNN